MNLNPNNSDLELQEMRALWNEWDPLRVSPKENDALDEYDFYLVPTLLLLKQVTTIVDIENYLNLVLEERMGLDKERTNQSNPHEFANKLQIWFQNLKIEDK